MGLEDHIFSIISFLHRAEQSIRSSAKVRVEGLEFNMTFVNDHGCYKTSRRHQFE